MKKKCNDCPKFIDKRAKRCKSCNGKYLHSFKKIGNYKVNPITKLKYYCKDCDKEICVVSGLYGTQLCIFCSRKYYTDGRTNKQYYCIECKEKETTFKTALYGSGLCAFCCRKDYIGEKAPNYIDGRSYFPYPKEFNEPLKLKIRKRDNFKCQNCNITEEEYITIKNKVLDVHHIDYDKTNYQEKNLISLCFNCHMHTNANRDYWYAYFAYIMEVNNGS